MGIYQIGELHACSNGNDQDAAADLAKQLANPIASLTSEPLQYNSR